MKNVLWFACGLCVLFLLSLPVLAQGQDDIDVTGAKVDSKKVEEAVKKGAEWLKSRQNANGSWLSGGSTEAHYPGGTTALALLALLKAGVDPNDPVIVKGFDFCFNVTGNRMDGQQSGWEHRTYSVSCLILALEARYVPKPKNDDEKASKEEDRVKKGLTTPAPYDEEVRKKFRQNASPQDRKVMDELVDWLLAQQQTGVWRYPGPAQDGNVEDASNTQYAVLALNTARRLGYPIQANVWERIADYFLKYQEEKGEKVEWFPVPGADFLVKDLKKMEKEVLKQLTKARREEYLEGLQKGEKEGKEGDEAIKNEKKEGPATTTAEIPNPYQKFGDEKKKMFARGWGYIPKGKAPKFEWMEVICGSMTTSGVAALMVAKVGLEETDAYGKWQKKVDQGIRDGCAWLAENFAVDSNPGRGGYLLYYLYGMERDGVLTLTRMFGKHDWYEEGANFLLKAQRPNGSWNDDANSDQVATCFAILFLKKATTPIVQIPEDIYTGEGLLGPKKQPEGK
jgi:hypothetical protein